MGKQICGLCFVCEAEKIVHHRMDPVPTELYGKLLCPSCSRALNSVGVCDGCKKTKLVHRDKDSGRTLCQNCKREHNLCSVCGEFRSIHGKIKINGKLEPICWQCQRERHEFISALSLNRDKRPYLPPPSYQETPQLVVAA